MARDGRQAQRAAANLFAAVVKKVLATTAGSGKLKLLDKEIEMRKLYEQDHRFRKAILLLEQGIEQLKQRTLDMPVRTLEDMDALRDVHDDIDVLQGHIDTLRNRAPLAST
jgi:hypothetical protein